MVVATYCTAFSSPSANKQPCLITPIKNGNYAKIVLHIMPDTNDARIYLFFATCWSIFRPSIVPSHGKEVVADFLAAADLSPAHARDIDDSHYPGAVPTLIHKESL